MTRGGKHLQFSFQDSLAARDVTVYPAWTPRYKLRCEGRAGSPFPLDQVKLLPRSVAPQLSNMAGNDVLPRPLPIDRQHMTSKVDEIKKLLLAEDGGLHSGKTHSQLLDHINDLRLMVETPTETILRLIYQVG